MINQKLNQGDLSNFSQNVGYFENLIGSTKQLIGNSLIKNQDFKEITPEESQSLLGRIARNSPAYEIFSTLKIGDSFSSYIFTGIKDLNDSLGQAFVDQLLKEFKCEFQKKITGTGNDINLVWDDYKNFVITPEVDGITQENISQLMNEAYLKLLMQEKIATGLPAPGVIGESGIIEQDDELTVEENIQVALGIARMNLEGKTSGVTQSYFDMLKQGATINQNNYHDTLSRNQEESSTIDGNVCRYTGNIYTIESGNGRGGIYEEVFNDDNNFTDGIIKLFIEGKIPVRLELHTYIAQTYYLQSLEMLMNESVVTPEGITFEVNSQSQELIIKELITRKDGVNFTSFQTIQIFEGGRYSREFTTLVRKKKIPTEMALYKKTRKLFDMYITKGEAIFPFWKDQEGDRSCEEYQELKTQIEEKYVNQNLLKKYANGYYKGGLSKEAFAENLEGKKGLLVFIDIKDMGSINMQDIYDTLAKVDRGDITYKQAILQSGDVMTQKFISIIDALKKDLPWYIDGKSLAMELTVGGDEIQLFLEGEINNQDKLAQEIQSTIMKAGAIGRVTCMQKSEEADGPEILNKLDQKTNYSKKIEAIFDKIESRLFGRVKIAEEAAIELKSNRSFTGKSIFHKKLMTDLLDSDDMHDAYADGIGKLHLKNTTNKIERMKKLFNFHIDLGADGNVKRDRIVFNKSKDNILFAKKREFFFNDIFDSVSGELLSESAFISFLHKKGLGRENRTTDK